jgi:molecular chaperone DnaJ
MESYVVEEQDYYKLLGLTREAQPEEIRKAYRRLARESHPDVNGGDEEATARFKAVTRAYEVLSDPEKRSRYDRFGASGVEPGGGGPGADFGFGGGVTDIFDFVFGMGGRGGVEQGPPRGDDIRYDLELTLEEVLHGTEKKISLDRVEHCSECGGNGARPGTRPQACVACGGRGRMQSSRQTIFGTMSQVSDCYRCSGRGVIVTEPCPKCRGRSVERQARQITVQAPPGVGERTYISRRGEGDVAPFGGAAGDLHVVFHIKPHPRFRRHGTDLKTEVEVSFARAALGGPVEIPTLEGVETQPIPEGTQPGDVFRLSGKGLPELNRPQARGDLLVEVRVRTPSKLNDRQRKALQEFAEAGGEDLSQSSEGHHEGGLFAWVRNLFTGRDDEPQ